MIKPFPLRYSLPLFLLLFGAVLTCFFIADSIRFSDRHIEAEARMNLNSLGERFATQLEYYYSHNEGEFIASGNALISRIPHLRSSAIFDEANHPLVPTRARIKPPADYLSFVLARKTLLPQIQTSENNQILTGAFPFRLGPGHWGILNLEMDLVAIKNLQLADDFRRAELFCVLALLLVVLSWLYLDRMLTQRMASLIAATRDLAAGNLSQRTSLQGMDELAEIGLAFNQMADQVQMRTEELKHSEEHYRRLVETCYEGILEMDGLLRLVFVNRRLAEMLGFTIDVMMGRFITDFLFPEDVSAYQKRVASRHLSDTVVYECRFRSRTGGEVWGIVSANNRWDESRRFAGAFCMVTDITLRKKAELQLLLHDSALIASANAVIITDVEGRIEWVNPAFTKLTGYTSAEAVGQNTRLLRSGEHPVNFYADLWADIRSGKTWEGEIINKRKTGDTYSEHMTIAPIRRDNGVISHFVAIKEDITEQRRFERQLRESQKAEAVARLAGGVAHDFNNILTTIIGYVDILKRSQPHTPAIQEIVFHISSAAQRATNLTRQLSIFSQQQPAQLQPLNLNEVLTHLFNIVKHLLGEHIVMQCNLDPVLPNIQADASLVEQVIIAITNRAKDCMPGAGRLVFVTQVRELDQADCKHDPHMRPGKFVCLTISDNGAGMNPETVQRVFEPFGEKGLGLATVCSIIKQHHGWVTVASRPEAGTTFEIFLPVAPEATTAPMKISPAPQFEEFPGGKTILLVEDDVSVSNLVSLCIRRLGCQVLTASDVPLALKLWNEHSHAIDLLLTDIVLPGDLSGADLAGQLIIQKPKLKVIFSSGYSFERAKKNIGGLDESNYLAKPYDPETLVKVVRNILFTQT